ncbi:MAG: hypothetical protein AMXMBFR59_06910 [Rhodanobacteraceae bacterium]
MARVAAAGRAESAEEGLTARMGVDVSSRRESGRDGRKAKRSAEWREIYGGKAFCVPDAAITHDNFIRLSPFACKLLLDLGRQYKGKNNGWLDPCWKLMEPVGWKSRETLFNAIRELEHYGWIERTRQGGRNASNLYRLTWRRINSTDENRNIPLDVAAPTLQPDNKWLRTMPTFDKDAHRKQHEPRQATRQDVAA